MTDREWVMLPPLTTARTMRYLALCQCTSYYKSQRTAAASHKLHDQASMSERNMPWTFHFPATPRKTASPAQTALVSELNQTSLALQCATQHRWHTTKLLCALSVAATVESCPGTKSHLVLAWPWFMGLRVASLDCLNDGARHTRYGDLGEPCPTSAAVAQWQASIYTKL